MTAARLPAPAAVPAPMSVFERYLTVWVFLCIVVGIGLGQLLPGPVQAIGRMEVAKVNLPVGLLIWVMIIPMLLKVDFGALNQVKQHWRGIGVTLFVNWAVKPFSMALLGWLALALGPLHSPTAALAAAVFGPWSALAASLLAAGWSTRPVRVGTGVPRG